MTPLHLLALNVGSATLKAALFELAPGDISTGPDIRERARAEIPVGAARADDQLDALLRELPASAQSPDVVVHRIVHGGDLEHGREIDAALLAQLQALAPLVPLHQPPALVVAETALARWPSARHGAAFDTSFHAALAPWSRRLPIPQEWHAQGVRRHGSHGLAFASVLRIVTGLAPRLACSRAVFAHLGGGCSVCAVRDGTSIDTTMALTPLGGLLGPTRSGDLDPGAVLHLVRTTGSADLVEQGLSRRGGLQGLAQERDVRALLARDDLAARLALEQFVMRVAQAIAAMATAAGGMDHLVFSGGIGHRSPIIRERIIARLAWLGLELDPDANGRGAARLDRGGAAAVWSVAVDEERELALSSLSWLATGQRA